MKCVNAIQENYSNHALPVVISWGDGLEFKGVVDLIKMKAYTFAADGKATEQDIPDDMKSAAQEWHDKLVEAAAESDEALMEKYFDEGGLSNDELYTGLAKGIADRSVYPIFCGSATTVAGVTPLLDYAVKLFPVPGYAGDIKCFADDKEVTRKFAKDEKTSDANRSEY